MEKTLFLYSRSVPLTLYMIHLHSICELATGPRQRKLARSRGPAAWHITVHQQGPKRYSMLAARKGVPLSVADHLEFFTKDFKPQKFTLAGC